MSRKLAATSGRPICGLNFLHSLRPFLERREMPPQVGRHFSEKTHTRRKCGANLGVVGLGVAGGDVLAVLLLDQLALLDQLVGVQPWR